MTSPSGLILTDDLLFASRVTATARSHGIRVEQVRDTDQIAARAKISAPSCVLLDLQVAGDRIEQLVTSLAALSPPPFIVAYGSHVDVASMSAARKAGCNVVLPRSAFADCLKRELPRWFSHSS
jgi:ActR/RegA family two-component response regulator